MNFALRIGLIGVFSSSLLGEPERLPEEGLEKAVLESQLRFLASDELAGRETGTSGNDVAARYIAEQFRSAGVEPPAGQKDYFQTVGLIRPQPPATASVEFRDRLWSLGENLLLIRGEGSVEPTPVVFLEHTNRDSSGSEANTARGKVVATRFRMPGRPDMNELQEMGAVALIEIYSGNRWNRLRDFVSRRPLVLAGEAEEYKAIPHVVLHLEAAEDGEELGEEMASFEVPAWDLQPVASRNVVGVIAGSDPNLKHEFVALMAHYDHLGSGGDKMFATPEDVIFNGARDNGMGVVALLSAAHSLTLRPPARSIVLLALTGEEQGLLGSAHYVADPIVPLEKTVFALNVDGGGYSDTGVVTVIGLGDSGRRPHFEAAAAESGLEAVAEPPEARGLINRSDNANFSRRGIPAVIFSPGFRKFDSETTRHYHRPSDEADENFDFDYLTKFCQALVRTARTIAAAR